MTEWTDNIPGLTIEANDNGTLTLQQDWCGNVDRVAVHPVHVRHLAERLGLIRETSACDADTLRTARADLAAMTKECARHRRNLLQIREHALELQHFLVNLSDWRHADLTSELERVNSLVALMDMACGDIADIRAMEPTANPSATVGEPMGCAGSGTAENSAVAPTACALQMPKPSGKPFPKPGQLALEGVA